MTRFIYIAALILTCVANAEADLDGTRMVRRVVVEGNGAIREGLGGDRRVLLQAGDDQRRDDPQMDSDDDVPKPTTASNRSEERLNWLVFTSAGDHGVVDKWLPGRRYDVFVDYYGDNEKTPYKDSADIFERRKDCKFCNLKYWRDQDPGRFSKYTAIAVFDDDIQISPDDLNRLFAIRERYKLWVTTPSMRPQTHPWYNNLASVNESLRVRLVDFVEMSCPLFDKDKLWEFLDDFDPAVKGWGTDVWYTQFFGDELKNHQAVADCVTGYNPPTRAQTGKREILSHLGSDEERRKAWYKVAEERNLQTKNAPNETNMGKESDLSWPCALPDLL